MPQSSPFNTYQVTPKPPKRYKLTQADLDFAAKRAEMRIDSYQTPAIEFVGQTLTLKKDSSK